VPPAPAAAPAPPIHIAARQLAMLAIPAILVGVASSLILLALEWIAAQISTVVWTTIPDQLGIDGNGALWIIVALVLTGVAVGLVVTFVPGHAGPHPATVELAAPPLPVAILPSLALAMVFMLAGGVSLGPENPIMGINIGLAVFVGGRLIGRVPSRAWVGMAFAGTIGAMFGTPVAAALLLSESAGDPRISTWDRLFAPLVAAGAAAITTDLLATDTFAVTLTPYTNPQPIDVVSASVIAVVAAIVGLAPIYLFPISYAIFQRLGPPLVSIVVGGFVLGILGAIGGPISLFKGLAQMQTLALNVSEYTAGGLAFLVALKLFAVVIANTAGFRGGRIFPVVFAGVAMGLCINVLFPSVPQAIAVAASLLGILVSTTRSGWLALFMSAFLVGEAQMLPIMCIAVLPAWLVVTGRPELVVKVAPSAPAPQAT
jgi:H+/Cl- antiporter ClcA